MKIAYITWLVENIMGLKTSQSLRRILEKEDNDDRTQPVRISGASVSRLVLSRLRKSPFSWF